jgi:hypothetical protein
MATLTGFEPASKISRLVSQTLFRGVPATYTHLSTDDLRNAMPRLPDVTNG